MAFDMKKRLYLHLPIALLCAAFLSLFTLTPTQAEDLPIDINAIGRQEARDGQITTRVGAHLFTPDAQRVNEALAEQQRQRQAAALYLFSEVPTSEDVELHTQIINAANNSALFTQPATIINFTPPPPPTPMPMWIIVLVIALCATGGFIWAIVSAKKKRQRENVY